VNRKDFKYYSIIIIVYVFLLQYFTVSLQMDGMNVLLPALEAKFGWTRGEITSAISIASFLAVIVGFIFGTLILKFGIRKILIPSLIVLGLDVIWMSRTSTLNTFAISMIIIQILTVVIMVAMFALVANWYVKKRGRVLGIVTIAAPMTSATFVPIGTKMVESQGLGCFYTYVGLVTIALGLFAIFFIRNKPEDVGHSPDGIDLTEKEIEKIKKELDLHLNSEWTLKKIISTKETWLVTFGFGFIYLIMTGFMGQLIPRLLDVGISMDKALAMMSIAALLGMPMSYFWGWLDDKISTPKTCMIFSLVYVVAAISFIYISPDNMIVAFIAILCIANTTGGMMNLKPSLVAYVFGRKEYVNVSRYVELVQNILRSFAFVIMGFAFDKFGTYTPGYILFIILALVSFVLIGMIKKTYDPERMQLLEKKRSA
jgi:sugar phosphate permease